MTKAPARTIREPARETPIAEEVDVCVIGGSCTGVFAAVTAARLGARVALVEAQGLLGGTATAGLVNVWHSLFDTQGERPIIGGLTAAVIDRLVKRGAAICYKPDESRHAVFNSAELAVELDVLVLEHQSIRPFLHARFAAPILEGDRMVAAVVEDKSGRRAIRARAFIDATGDGDVIARIGWPTRRQEDLQPPTVCLHLQGLDAVRKADPKFNLSAVVHDPRFPNALRRGFLWHMNIPELRDLTMVAGTRAHGADCSDADDLTRAEMECRRQARAIRDIVHDHVSGGDAVALAAVASHIGIRETRHAICLHSLTEPDVLDGVRFPDAIANGSYRVDVHHSDRAGLTFRYLDGREEYLEPGQARTTGRWRPTRAENPTFYQIPYRCLVPQPSRNVLVAGRLMDADRGAYGAIRVMVNCNQTGEAAGAAAALALQAGTDVADVDVDRLRKTLSKLGSIII